MSKSADIRRVKVRNPAIIYLQKVSKKFDRLAPSPSVMAWQDMCIDYEHDDCKPDKETIDESIEQIEKHFEKLGRTCNLVILEEGHIRIEVESMTSFQISKSIGESFEIMMVNWAWVPTISGSDIFEPEGMTQKEFIQEADRFYAKKEYEKVDSGRFMDEADN